MRHVTKQDLTVQCSCIKDKGVSIVADNIYTRQLKVKYQEVLLST